MADQKKFDKAGAAPPVGTAATNLRCPECEPMFAGYLDGTLDIATLTLVEAHIAGCPACAAELRLVRQGREWLQMLRSADADLAVPAGLADKILARTSGAVGSPETILDAAGDVPPVSAAPWRSVNLAAVRSNMRRTGLFDARMAMTAAMAFFSITLTLSVAGIRLNDLRPSNLRHTVTRTYSDTNAHVVRYYENMRVVYQLESRVRELRRAAEANDATRSTRRPRTTPESNGKPQTTPQSNTTRPVSPMNDGVAHRDGKTGKKADPEPEPVVTGQLLEASFTLMNDFVEGNTPSRSALSATLQVRPSAAPHQMQRSEA